MIAIFDVIPTYLRRGIPSPSKTIAIMKTFFKTFLICCLKDWINNISAVPSYILAYNEVWVDVQNYIGPMYKSNVSQNIYHFYNLHFSCHKVKWHILS